MNQKDLFIILHSYYHLRIAITCMKYFVTAMDVIVTHRIPNIYAVSLVKLLCTGSLTRMHKTVYFIQPANLLERTNVRLKKMANKHGRVSLF